MKAEYIFEMSDTQVCKALVELFERVKDLEEYVNAPRLSSSERAELLKLLKGLTKIVGKRYTHVSYHDMPVAHIRFHFFGKYDSIVIPKLPTNKRLVIGKKYLLNELLGDDYDIC